MIDTDLGQAALARPEVLRLMSVPGIDATVALSIVAVVGDFTRFRTPEKLAGVDNFIRGAFVDELVVVGDVGVEVVAAGFAVQVVVRWRVVRVVPQISIRDVAV